MCVYTTLQMSERERERERRLKKKEDDDGHKIDVFGGLSETGNHREWRMEHANPYGPIHIRTTSDG